MVDAFSASAIAAAGSFCFCVLAWLASAPGATALPIDAVPDITNVQVQINTPAYRVLAARGRAAHHVSSRDRDGRLPGLEYTRSLSRYGLSQVTVVFRDGTDIYFARQLINERLQEARGSCPEASCQRWARSRRVWVRSSLHASSREGARQPDGQPLHAHGPARHCRTGSSGRSSGRFPGHGGQHHRRIREPVST